MNNAQFKFEKQDFTLNDWMYLNAKPEHVLMIELQQSMKRLKMRSFKSYLKYMETKRIQRSTIGLNQIASLLNISFREADNLAHEWKNNKQIGGTVVYTAGLNCYYLSDVYEIIA